MKKIAMLLLGTLLTCQTAFAQEVVVNGVGADKESALRDAMRNAVGTVIGTYVNAKTLVDQSVVVEDEIYAKSQGFVKNIKILSADSSQGVYTIKARIDVNTDPNSELADKIQMILSLGDPRIGIIITYYDDGYNEMREKYPLICESALNSKLAELGFSHVVSAEAILNERGMDRQIASDPQNLLPHNSIDYLIVGKLDLHTGNIALPKYNDLTQEGNTGFYDTTLIASQAELDIDVFKADTGEIVNSYRVERKVIKNTNNNAENAAIKELGMAAAEKLRSVFARKAANTDSSMQMLVTAESFDELMDIKKALTGLAGIRSVDIRNFDNGQGVILLDTDLKPQTVFRMLREKSDQELSVQRYAANSLEVIVR